MNLWNARRTSGGRASLPGGRRPSWSWDSSLCFPSLEGSEGAPGQLQTPRLAHHFTQQPPSGSGGPRDWFCRGCGWHGRQAKMRAVRAWEGLNAYAHRFFPGKGEEGSARCLFSPGPSPGEKRSVHRVLGVYRMGGSPENGDPTSTPERCEEPTGSV